jgi:hypothetical protein
MADVNLKPSQRASIVGAIDPQSSTTAKTSGWIDATVFHNYMAVIATGVIAASGTVDAKIQQATDSSGTGAKDVTGKAITQLTQAASGSSKQALINLKQEDLDIANGFKFFQLSVTPATAAALIMAAVFGFDARYGAASDTGNVAASQAQTV